MGREAVSSLLYIMYWTRNKQLNTGMRNKPNMFNLQPDYN